mgnify:CR=1 FL=1
MKKALCVLLAVFLLAGTFYAKPKKKEGPKEEPKIQAQKGEFLRTKDIQGSLDPSLAFLADMGLKIDEAREKSDAIEIASCALLLFWAEKISGKESPIITGKTLLEEASKLAETQKNPKALEAVAKIWGDAVNGPGDTAMMEKYTEMAKVFLAEKKDVKRSYSETGSVQVNNNTGWDMYIYIDGYYQGVLYAYQDKVYYGVPAGSIKLYASAADGTYWGPNYYTLSVGGKFTWNLWP